MPTVAQDEHTALRSAVRDLLDRECPPAVVRAAWTNPSAAWAVWRRLGGAGVPALLVPEAAGGLGLDETYLVAVLEETGYAAVPAATVESAAAAPLLPATLLGPLLEGEAMVTVDTGGTVPYGEIATAVLVLSRGTLIRPLTRLPVAGVDGARRLARVAGDDVVLPVTADVLATARLRATLGTAAELVGLSRRMLDLTVRYVSERRQFGVPVGSFQAVKHHLAGALLAVSFAAPLVHRAAESLARGSATAGRDVSMAKATASDAAREVAKLTLQCHGAMAYTTEYDHHLFAKRAWAQAAAWGGATAHRRVVAAALGLFTEEPS